MRLGAPQRLEDQAALSEDLERSARGDDDRDPGTGSHEVACDRSEGVSGPFGLVEEEREGTLGEGSGQRLQRVVDAEGDSERLPESLRDLVVAHVGQIEVGHRAALASLPVGLGEQLALAHSAGTEQRDDASGPEPHERLELRFATDQWGRGGGRRARGGRWGRGLNGDEPGVLRQDPGVQLLRRGARVHPELVAQGPAQPLVGREGLGLTAAAVRREHQQLVGSFAQWVAGDQVVSEGQRLTVGVGTTVVEEPRDQ